MTPLEALETIKECAWFGRSIPTECYATLETAIKALEIIKENCSIYTESLYPLGPAHWWNIHLKMRGYIADKKEKEMFDLLKKVLL